MHTGHLGVLSLRMPMLLVLGLGSKRLEYHRALHGTLNLLGSKGLEELCLFSKLAV